VYTKTENEKVGWEINTKTLEKIFISFPPSSFSLSSFNFTKLNFFTILHVHVKLNFSALDMSADTFLFNAGK
jgi:hypothetical protein